MPDRPKHEDDVLSAVRQFLHSSAANRALPEATFLLAAATSRLSVTNLEAWERHFRAELWIIDRTPSPSSPWPSGKTATRFVSWLDLCNGDGFMRERTLRTLLGGAPNSFFFALAIRRLNDWVPEVRAAACEHLPLIAKRSDPDQVADALWGTLPHCTSWGRVSEAEMQVLANLIAIEPMARALKSRILATTTGPATSILAQMGRTAVLDQWLSDIARNAIQPSVRASAYRFLLEGRVVWIVGRQWKWTDVRWCRGRFEPIFGERPLSAPMPFVDVLSMASADRSPMIRRVAGELLVRRLESAGRHAAELAKRLASDPFPSVAEHGKFALAKLNGRT